MKNRKHAGASAAAPAGREIPVEAELQHRVFKLALCAVLLTAAVVVIAVLLYGWLRYDRYRGYESSYKGAYVAEVGSAFEPLADNENKVPGMVLAAENDLLKLYAAPESGQVAVYDKRTGNITRSNPENADTDPIANKTNKAYLRSQLVIDYYNANSNAGSYDSYSKSTERGQMTCEKLKDGVRFVYGLGEIEEIKYYVPFFLTDEWYQKVQTMAEEKDAKNLARLYTTQNKDGLWTLIETAKKDNSKKKKADAALLQAGFTPDDYWEMQELGGVETAETLFFTVALDYRLSGDSLEVSVPTDLIVEQGGGSIYRIELLRFMGAASTEEQGYFVVPNGSGAIINFNNGKTTTPVYTQYVYGMDPVASDYTVTQNSEDIRLPVCGICREDSSVLISVERGAALCAFTADVSGRTNSYNVLQPVFTVRGTDTLTMFGVQGMSSDVPIIENDMYRENLTVRYSFPSTEYTGYSGLANYYREQLIDKGTLTPLAVEGDIPFFFDVISGVKETKHALGFRYLSLTPMTTFAEAGDIAAELREAGVSHPVMNLQGWFGGGYYHNAPDDIDVTGKLGGKKGLSALNGKMRSLGGELFADAAFQKISYIAKHYSPSKESSRYFGAGYSVRLGQVDPTTLRQTSSLGYSETVYDLLSPKFLPRYVQAFLKDFGKLDADGISLRDLGSELHSDKRRTNIISREYALDIVTDAFASLRSSGRNIMVQGGNLYALTGTSYVIDAPMQSTDYYIIDSEIPFYQMVVHGSVEYAGKEMNLSNEPIRQELLKSVEYGASCRYIFTAEEASEMKYTGLNRFYATYFGLWKEQAVEAWSFVNGALSAVRSAKMIGHERLNDNLVKVTYDNGVVIYVNYGGTPAAADGLTIPAEGYLVGGEKHE